MLAADEVVAAALARLVPELAALALADGVPAQDDVPAAREADRDLLVGRVRLADRRVAAGEEHGRLLPGGSVGHVDDGGHVDPGQGLEDELLDPVAVHRDRPRDAGGERRPRLRQAADQGEDLPPQLVLQHPQVGLGLHLGEPLLPRGVFGPGPLDLVQRNGMMHEPSGSGWRTWSISGVGRLGGQGRRGTGHGDGEPPCRPEESRFWCGTHE